MEEKTEQDIYVKLYNFYENSESRIKTNARVCRAYVDKVSAESINDKVNKELNAIKIGIKQINSKFNENNKNYVHTKELVTNTIANYESALVELSEFYDGKIEQLILRKVELEAELVGAILNDEYLYQKIIKKNEEKDSDKMKISLKDNIKMAIEKIKNRKKEKSQVDVAMVSKLMDSRDVINEIDEKNSLRIERTIENRKNNKEFILKAEKEISLIDGEIERINSQKKDAIFDAMEIGDKSISSTIKRPKFFKKITRFFVSRFNTPKVIENSIIEPLNIRIENFRNNELANMKG